MLRRSCVVLELPELLKVPQQSFEVRRRNFIANSVYGFLFKLEKLKNFSKHKVINDDGKEETCLRGEFPLVYNEHRKRPMIFLKYGY